MYLHVQNMFYIFRLIVKKNTLSQHISKLTIIFTKKRGKVWLIKKQSFLAPFYPSASQTSFFPLF